MATTKRRTVKPALRVGDETVRAKTGRTWEKWVSELDRSGGRKLDHAALAKLLRERFVLSPWWSQMVAVGYEQATGRRVAHQRKDGFSVGATRTIEVPVAALRAAWTDARARRRWLGASPLAGGPPAADGTMRARWGDGPSRLEVRFAAGGAARSQVTVDHTRLPDAAAAKAMREFWIERLAALKKLLEGA
jgi:uncharacterized protein YndB with AHSA1/START domain